MSKRINADICAFCGKREEDHHPFVPVNKPIYCVCDPLEYVNPERIPDVCKKFKGPETGKGTMCQTCEHDYECHDEANK